MPELPDVERFRRTFGEHAGGRTVERLWADPTILRGPTATPRRLDAALRGRTFDAEPARHGKWLVAWTDGPALLLHFGMTGFLVWSGDEPARHRHDRLGLELRGGGELRYRNLRKLGGVWLAHGEPEVRGILGRLGPDALTVGRAEVLRLLERRRGGAKAALMDQTFVAGVGNILADEILWQARLHPKERIEELDVAARTTLADRLRSVVRESVARYDYLARKRSWLAPVRGRPGAGCPRCGAALARTVAAGRTTYFCPACQPGPAGRMPS